MPSKPTPAETCQSSEENPPPETGLRHTRMAKACVCVCLGLRPFLALAAPRPGRPLSFGWSRPATNPIEVPASWLAGRPAAHRNLLRHSQWRRACVCNVNSVPLPSPGDGCCLQARMEGANHADGEDRGSGREGHNKDGWKEGRAGPLMLTEEIDCAHSKQPIKPSPPHLLDCGGRAWREERVYFGGLSFSHGGS